MEVQNHGGTPIMQKSQSPALTCATSWRGCLTRPLQVGLHLNEHFSPRHRSLWLADGCEKRSLCRNRVKKGQSIRWKRAGIGRPSTTPTPSRPTANGLIQIVHAMIMMMLKMIYFRPPTSKAFAPGYWPGRRQLCFQHLCPGSV